LLPEQLSIIQRWFPVVFSLINTPFLPTAKAGGFLANFGE